LFLVRLFGGRIASSANIYGGVRIWMPRNLVMEDRACLGPGVDCYCMDQITLRADSLVSQGAYLCGGTHDIDDPDFPLRTGPIVIGAHAWVAARTMVGPGVTVGEGAVLGGGAVTFRDLESWTVYGGNPATPLRKRRLERQDAS
jgi:putative colanic acid biosynthesis acetyltransferase WcaF